MAGHTRKRKPAFTKAQIARQRALRRLGEKATSGQQLAKRKKRKLL